MFDNFYKGKKVRMKHEYPLLARNENTSNIKGFSPKDVMYLITPDRFVNGDTENDELISMKEKLGSGNFDRHGGDLQGIINHLDYIHDLGFTAIWLNPALENNMEEASYHGYSTTDYYKIDPRYGSNEKLIKRGTNMIVEQLGLEKAKALKLLKKYKSVREVINQYRNES